MSEYRYTECGLDNVIIDGLDPIVDDDGDIVHSIPNIAGLHRVMARVIVDHAKGISGKELRFLRTEMGMTQAELAKMVHREHLTVGRWERGEIDIDNNAEVLIRIHASKKLDLDVKANVEELSARCVPTAEIQPILIDGSDPQFYRPRAA